ncbi:uncharacterized protein BKCO1_2800077 [Diplodia corticola]|uniref:Uncharacterized protein n=1 Tax=Diplodia corticola TaxID=236234 RepID=A0A1J9RZ79_9PEZI|nr:uncharacterized protein BKCO1_2800077 [Diplodia corticola]OJD33655.1 hypothetical protein BKCO1_2800077 [Diplodia corticola]
MASALSTPPSDPRHSTSSQPSQASSTTLHSAHDPHRHDHADPAAGKRRKLLGRVDSSAAAQQNSDTRPQGLLGADLGERDKRRRLPRRSGGFLLDAALPGSSARRRSRETRAEETDKRARSRHLSKSPSSYDGSRRAYSRGSSSRSRPLSGDTDVGPSGNGHAPEPYGARTPENRQDKAQARTGLGIDVEGANEYEENAVSPPNASIDPAQIINMALNLSESRRRNLGHGQLTAPSLPRSRRGTASGMGPNIPMQGSFYDYGIGGSLKQHLQQQRRVSRNMSPTSGRLSTPASRHVSMSSPNALMENSLGPSHNYTFTAATLSRAEKAKTYVELGAEYRRLLQNLPPLKPDSEAGYAYSAFSSPGSPTVELKKTLSRTGPDPLGRRYNPLQFIRNRKLRGRERRQLQPDVVDFEDIDRVRLWIDTVEQSASRQSYRQEDKVLLPPFIPNPMFQSSPEQPQEGVKRPSVLLGKQKRPRMDWFTLPTEFLADAVWLEKDNHKSLIEDRNGNRIFPSPRSASVLNPRLSRDQTRPSMDKRRVSTAGSMAGGGTFSEPRSNYSSEAESHRGRKKRHFLHSHREDSPERGKRLGWISRGRSSSSSGLSSSDDDMSARRKKHDRRLSTQDENIGPLERHMKTLLEDDARAESGLSPIISSPEKHWGASQAKAPALHRVASETESDVDRRAGAKRATKRLTLMSSNPPESRPSMDGLDSSVPNTPLSKTFSFGASSPPSRIASPDRSKSKRSKLPFFRSDGNAKAPKVDTLDFALDSFSHRPTSGEPTERGRLSISIDQPRRSNSLPRPMLLKSHKTTDSLSSLASIQEGKVSRGRKEGKDKEPSSAVTRFFKDVGREGSKARKFIFKKDKPPEEADEDSSSDDSDMSSTSDTEEEMSKSVLRRRPKPASRTGTDAGLSDASDISERPQGYSLPTFKSAASQDQKRDSSAEPRRGRTRPSRFDRLAPPRLDTNVSRSSSPGVIQVQAVGNGTRARSEGPVSHSRSSSAVRRRMTKLLELPGGAGRAGLPPSDLSRAPVDRKYSDRSPARPSPQRHWSITDENLSRRASASARHPCAAATIIANKRTDIARIQALLLCSGIKAAELARRAHSVPDTPPPFLLRAAETAIEHADAADAAAAADAATNPPPSNKQDLLKHTRLIPSVARKEQHVLAARILASDLEAGSAALAAATERFRAQRIRKLHARCEALRIELGDRLTPRCHACADDADAFTREVTSGAALAVKAVADRVDAMGRARRRRMRWVRRVGWMLLEWCVLGVMWWVWLVVVVVRTGLAAVRGVGRGVRWFLWLE